MRAALAQFSGPLDPPEVGHASVDGLPWTAERGVAGDLLLRWGDRGAWWVAPDAATVVAAADEDDPAVRRVAEDSVRVTVALAQGHEALHAAVVVPGGARGAVAVLGGQGAGKTSTALALLRAGGRLVADDVAVLDLAEPAAVLPGPPTMNVPAGTAVPGAATVRHRFGDEDWVELEAAHVAYGPVPLRAVVLLDRTAPAGTAPELTELPFAAPVLLAHALDSGRRRQAARFTRLAALAEHVAVQRLHAPPDATPDALAAVLGT